jgi:hypothetical protein
VEPATPEGKPMRISPTTTVTPPDTLPTYNAPEETAPAPQAEDDMTETQTENREYYIAIIDGALTNLLTSRFSENSKQDVILLLSFLQLTITSTSTAVAVKFP